MDYEGWMLALYEVYREEYNRYYKVSKEKFFTRLKSSYKSGKIKGVCKEFLTFPSKKNMIGFIIYCFVEIVALIIYFSGIIKEDSIKTFTGVVLIAIPPLILINTYKFKIDSYERCIIVLNNVLKLKGMYSNEKINTLIIDSGKYINKNKKINYIIQFLQIIIPILTAVIGNQKIIDKYSGLLKGFDYNYIKILSLIITVLICGIAFYLMFINRPDGKKQKLKELNNLLKITLLYK